MISGGNVTVHVSNLDAAIRFYTEQLGLRLTHRFGDRWAAIDAGPSYWTTDEVNAGLTIGLHPASAERPAPGTRGAVMFGLETYEPMDELVARLRTRGVRIDSPIMTFEAGTSVTLEDPDGNPIYLWEPAPEMVSDTGADPGDESADTDPAASLLSGGHATVYVSSMDAAVRFYTEVLGLPLTNRYGDHWATVEAGHQLVIGLHPASLAYPPPGTKGAMLLGLSVDEPMERVVSRLAGRGVRIIGHTRPEPGAMATIEDADGNPILLMAAAMQSAPDEEIAAPAASR